MKKLERKQNKKRKAASLVSIARSNEADRSKIAIESGDISNYDKKPDPVRHFRLKIPRELTHFNLILER